MNVIQDPEVPANYILGLTESEASALREAAIERADATLFAYGAINAIDGNLLEVIRSPDAHTLLLNEAHLRQIAHLTIEYSTNTRFRVQQASYTSSIGNEQVMASLRRCDIGLRAVQIYAQLEPICLQTDALTGAVEDYLELTAIEADFDDKQ